MRFLLAILAATLVACAYTPRFNHAERTRLEPPYRTPTGSETQVAYVGDPLLQVGRRVVAEAIVIEEPVRLGAWDVAPGDYLVTEVKADGVRVARIRGEDAVRNGRGTGWALYLDPPVALEWRPQAGRTPRVCMRHPQEVWPGGPKCAEHHARIEWLDVPDPRVFEKRLIYNGRTGPTLRVGYREFANDTARPAFANEVEYDLSKSRYVGYGGAKLEVVRVSNEAIEYRVLRSFSHRGRSDSQADRRRRASPAALDRR